LYLYNKSTTSTSNDKSTNIIRNLSCHQINKIWGKTGLDNIPVEIYQYGGTALHVQLLKFYGICLTAQELLQQFKDALIIAIYKKKGDRSDKLSGHFATLNCEDNSGKNPS